ncbi:MAG: magnesium transporter [Planctomycetota bacterium]
MTETDEQSTTNTATLEREERRGSIDELRVLDDDAIRVIEEIEDPIALASELAAAEPHVAARVFSAVPAERAAAAVDLLGDELAAAALAEMEPHRAAEVVSAMPAAEAADVLEEMDPDDRVDVLDECEEQTHDDVVAELEHEERLEVEALEKYETDTAGGIMTTEVTSLYEALSVADAIETLRRLSEEVEQMFYVYVVDRRGHLVGVLSMRDMILSRPDRTLRELMIEGVRSVPATMDQEEVAALFRKYDYLAMPVVDERGRLVGLITVDDIVDVLQEETTEDVHKLFGAGAEERLDSPWQLSFQKRVGWLVVNLGTSFAAAGVVAAFAGMIAALPILAVFMPIIAGMGGNASAQAMAVAVRGLSTGAEGTDRRLLKHVILREFKCGLLTGLVIGVMTAVIAILYTGTTSGDFARASGLAGVVFLALVINHTLACTTGAGIPFLMKRLGFDPAQSATILATTVTDVVGFLALLGLAFVAANGLGLL